MYSINDALVYIAVFSRHILIHIDSSYLQPSHDIKAGIQTDKVS